MLAGLDAFRNCGHKLPASGGKHPGVGMQPMTSDTWQAAVHAWHLRAAECHSTGTSCGDNADGALLLPLGESRLPLCGCS